MMMRINIHRVLKTRLGTLAYIAHFINVNYVASYFGNQAILIIDDAIFTNRV